MKLILSLVLLFSITANSQVQEINPIVGDTSWFKYQNGEWPNAATKEKERISQHLQYVLEKLRHSEPAELELKSQREKNLQLLEHYIQRQVFPSPIDYHQNRRPCFIDDLGNICAVGYLLEKTANREEAERINSLFQYEYLLNMKDKSLMNWQKSSGLSLKELAMIQPTYRMRMPRRSVFYDERKKKYGTKGPSGKKIYLKAKYDAIFLGCYPNSPVGSEGTEMVKLKGKWAILKSLGKAVTKFKYDTIVGSNSLKRMTFQLRDIEPNPNHIFLFAYQGKKVDVFSSLGEFLFSKEDCEIVDFQLGVFQFKRENKIGVLDEKGQILIAAKYEEIKSFNDSKSPCYYSRVEAGYSYDAPIAYRLKLNEKFALMDSKTKLIFPFEFDLIERVGRNLWKVVQESKSYLFNDQGKKITGSSIQEVKIFGECKTQNLRIKIQNKFGVLDSSNQWLLEPVYDYIERNSMYYEVRKNGLTGLLHPDASPFLEMEYDYIHRRSDGTFLFSKNNLLGKYTADGKTLIPTKYKNLTKLYDDDKNPSKSCYYGAEEWGKWKIITDQGLQIGNQTFDSVLHVGYDCFRVKLDKYWYFGKYSGGSIIFQKDLKVEEFTWINSGIYAFKQNGKFGLWWIYYIKTGEGKLFDPKFDEIFPINFGGTRFLIKNEGKFGMADRRGILIIPTDYDEYRDIQKYYGAKHGMCFRKGETWYYYEVSGDKIEEARPHILLKLKEQKANK